jgi:hypothetical protein
MNIRLLLLTIGLALGLAGCFTSEKPLFSDAEAVAPYAKITFSEVSAKEATVLTRTGKSYVSKQKDDTITSRLKPVETGIFFVEMSGMDKNGKVERLYALLKLDPATGTATSWKAMAQKEDIGPGLRDCKDGTICIDDINAYVALAKAAIDAGGKPDTTYKVKLE